MRCLSSFHLGHVLYCKPVWNIYRSPVDVKLLRFASVASGGTTPGLGALPFFCFCMGFHISLLLGLPCVRCSPGGISMGSPGGGLLSSSLKYSVHLFLLFSECLSILVCYKYVCQTFPVELLYPCSLYFNLVISMWRYVPSCVERLCPR